MLAFSLGGSEHERVAVEVANYERAPTGDYHDDNWLSVTVTVSVGAFGGTFPASFLTEEFVAFRNELKKLHETLRGDAKFTTLEDQLSLDLSCNGRGQIFLKGYALDRAGDGNRIEFQLQMDQTYLTGATRELDAIIEKFPVRAS
jgi:hypothetical protein